MITRSLAQRLKRLEAHAMPAVGEPMVISRRLQQGHTEVLPLLLHSNGDLLRGGAGT